MISVNSKTSYFSHGKVTCLCLRFWTVPSNREGGLKYRLNKRTILKLYFNCFTQLIEW